MARRHSNYVASQPSSLEGSPSFKNYLIMSRENFEKFPSPETIKTKEEEEEEKKKQAWKRLLKEQQRKNTSIRAKGKGFIKKSPNRRGGQR